MDVMQIHANFMADTGQFQKSVADATAAVQDFSTSANKSAANIERSFNNINSASHKMLRTLGTVSAIGASALTVFGVKAFNAAARVEELDIAMQAVGKSSNSTYTELIAATKAIADNGIEMDSAQEIALKFAKNNLDLAEASKIARVAQDLAVISQANSTETTNRLIHAVITQNSMVLRQAGIQKTAGDAYKDYAKEIGKTTAALSAQEKQTAIVNLILKEGELVAGTYEASMRSAGKILRSFPRIIKAINVGFGTMLSEGLAPVILSTYQMVAAFSKLVSEGGALYPIMQGLGYVVAEFGNPLRMAMDAATRFLKTFTLSKESISGFIETIRQALPLVAALGAGLAVMGGAQLFSAVPILGSFLGMLNPILVGLVVLIATMPQLQQAFAELVNAVKPAIPAFIEIAKAFSEILVIAIAAVVPLIRQFAEIIKPVAKFLGDNAKAVGVIGAAFLTFFTAVLAMNKVILIFKGILIAAKTAWLAFTGVLLLNPIGLIIAAVVALAAAFVLLWKRSDTFRKGVITVLKVTLSAFAKLVRAAGVFAKSYLKFLLTPLRLFLMALSKLPGVGKKAKEGLDLIDSGLNFVTGSANKGSIAIKNYADNLDKLNKVKPVAFFDAKDRRGADYFRPQADENKKKVITDDGTDIGASLKELKDSLRKAVRAYNDFIKFEFAKDFTKGADQARGAILKGLDMLERVFEEKAKSLTGQALLDLEKGFNAIRKQVRSFIPQAEALAATFQKLEEELNQAEDDLKRALESRAQAVERLNDLFREPFGEPSALQRSLSSAEATVDSIINMYDDLIQTITERFEGIEPARRDELINFLTDQTAALVALARKRATAVEVLKEAQDELDDLLSDQVAFQTNLTSSLKGFASAIANLSQTDSATTLKVIKTATGLVVTQLQQSSSGIDKITKQLQDRLRTIRDFGNNIRTLLASGLNREYIKQLLEAGPEAAGLTAAALATAGADQISEINNLYAEIDSMSNSFGRDMAVVFYQNAVDMATAFRDGAAAEVQSITDQMTAIRVSIETALAPLRDMAANLGEDTMQVLLDSIKKRKGEVLAEIQDLVNKIAELMAAAARSIGVEVTSKPGAVGGGGGGGFVTPTGIQKETIQEDLATAVARLKDLQSKIGTKVGAGAINNLLKNIELQKQIVKDTQKDLKSAIIPSGSSNVSVPKSSISTTPATTTNINSGAVQITVTNTAGGSIDAADIEQAVTDGMLAALDGRRMVAV